MGITNPAQKGTIQSLFMYTGADKTFTFTVTDDNGDVTDITAYSGTMYLQRNLDTGPTLLSKSISLSDPTN